MSAIPLLSQDTDGFIGRINVAAMANAHAVHVTSGAPPWKRRPPILTHLSPVSEIAAWLQWCDPNGSHTDELARSAGVDPYTPEDVWNALAEMLDEGRDA